MAAASITARASSSRRSRRAAMRLAMSSGTPSAPSARHAPAARGTAGCRRPARRRALRPRGPARPLSKQLGRRRGRACRGAARSARSLVVEEVVSRRADQEHRRGERLVEELQQIKERRLGPVKVFEHHDAGGSAASAANSLRRHRTPRGSRPGPCPSAATASWRSSVRLLDMRAARPTRVRRTGATASIKSRSGRYVFPRP